MDASPSNVLGHDFGLPSAFFKLNIEILNLDIIDSILILEKSDLIEIYILFDNLQYKILL